MPDVPYFNKPLANGNPEPFAHEAMNTLFAEADRKISLALDGKSLLFWTRWQVGTMEVEVDTATRFCDPFIAPREHRFTFYTGTPFFIPKIFSPVQFPGGGSDLGYWNYSQTPFDAAAAATEIMDAGDEPFVDHRRRIVVLKDVAEEYMDTIDRLHPANPRQQFFQNSLKVMTKMHRETEAEPLVPYNILSDYARAAWRRSYIEKVLEYDVAELVYEGISEVTFSAAYNKFKCFRIHNLSSTPLLFTFAGQNLALDGTVFRPFTVPAWGSQTVRRTTLTTGYELGYNHFFKMREGDCRFYNGYISTRGDGLPRRAVENNLVNPQIIADIIRRMAGQTGRTLGCGAKLILDETKFWDASGIYSTSNYPPAGASKKWALKNADPLPGKSFFGDPSNDATLVGDLLYHTGKLYFFGVPTEEFPDGDFFTPRPLNFNGLASITEDFAAAGFVVTSVAVSYDAVNNTWSGGTVSIKAPEGEPQDRHLVSLSTNLLVRTGSVATTLNADPGLVIQPYSRLNVFQGNGPMDQAGNLETIYLAAARQPLVFHGYWRRSAEGSRYSFDTDGSQTDAYNYNVFTQAERVDKPISPLATVGAIKDFSALNGGAVDYPFQDELIAFTQTSRGLRLTGFGPIFSFTFTASLNAPLPSKWCDASEYSFLRVRGSEDPEDESYVLEERGFLRLGANTGGTQNNDWPHWLFGYPFGQIPQFPHVPRYRSAFNYETAPAPTVFYPGVPAGIKKEPWLSYTPDKTAVLDDTLNKAGATRAGAFAMLGMECNVADIVDGVATGALPYYPDEARPDGYYADILYGRAYEHGQELTVWRVRMSIEHYNNIASLVNACVSYRPLHFFDFFPDMLPSEDAWPGLINGWRPKNQFPITAGTAITVALGLASSGYADLPQSYRDLFTDCKAYLYACLHDFYGETPSNAEIGTQNIMAAFPQFFMEYFQPFNTLPAVPGWVTIEAVQAKAAALGFKFYWHRAVVPAVLESRFGDPGNIVSDNDIATIYGGVDSQVDNYYTFVNDFEGEWVKDAGANPKLRADYEPLGAWPGNVMSVGARKRNWFFAGIGSNTGGMYGFVDLGSASEGNGNVSNSPSKKDYLPVQPSFDTDHWGVILFLLYCGESSSSGAIKTPVATWNAGSGRVADLYGDVVTSGSIYFYPVEDSNPPVLVPAAEADPVVSGLPPGETPVTAETECDTVKFFINDLTAF